MKERSFGLRELVAMAIGGVIGAGAITHIGVAISYTGHSAWLAYLVAVILGALFCLPIAVMTSALRLEGGIYTLVGSILGKKAAGVYAAGFLFYYPGIAIYALSMGHYVQSLLPGVNAKLCAIIVLTAFYLVNLTGAKLMAKAQKVMVILLVIALGGFIVFGLGKINQGVFDFAAPDFLLNGPKGFVKAIFLLFYSVTGYYWVMFYGRHAKNPTKNIPLSMLIAVCSILILYPGIGIVAGGVLPVEQVANQPLTWVAGEVFNKVLFVIFMICGPFMALMTTINSLFISYCEPIREAADDGWFGKLLGKTNRRNAPVGALTLLWVIGIIPILLNLDIATITNSYMLIDYTLIYLMMFALLRVPKLLPEQWANRKIRVPDGVYYSMVIVAMIIQTATIIAAATSLTPIVLTVSITIMTALLIYALLRDKSGKVNIQEKELE